jgi:hypothetical protein
VALYHFSEDPNIRVFRPHVPAHRDDVEEALVYAIDKWHAPMYYFPRQCPRACFWPGPQTTPEDRDRWFHGVDARMVIAIESGWLDALRTTTLYRYTMPEATFTLHGDDSGHAHSRETVEPIAVEPVGDLLAALVGADVELRITPRLYELWQGVIQSTLSFSGTRLRNAKGWIDAAD